MLQGIIDQLRTGEATVRGVQIVATCPYCHKEEHLYIHKSKGVYHCFRCGAGGTMQKAMHKNLGVWRRAVLSSDRVLSQRDLSSLSSGIPGSIRTFPLPQEVSGGFSSVTGVREKKAVRDGYDYCVRRGVSDFTMREYEVAAGGDRRVYFPVGSFFVARAIDEDTTPKTLEPAGSDKPLFGRHVTRHSNFCFLVEGVFDHFATPFSYATLQSTVSQRQAFQLITDRVEDVVVVFDEDVLEKTKKVLGALPNSIRWWMVVLPPIAKDPDGLGGEYMRGLVSDWVKNRLRFRSRVLHAVSPQPD